MLASRSSTRRVLEMPVGFFARASRPRKASTSTQANIHARDHGLTGPRSHGGRDAATTSTG